METVHPVGACECDDRKHAEARGEFVFVSSWGWIFRKPSGATAQMRTLSRHGRVAINRRGDWDHSDCSGEPVIWATCPFCGGDLPGVEDE